jgi:(4-(4-[2-(gamma-L-glutamylamino)ethyl]phenoxymethyl)furan-2-yl)methanamine synthase
VSVSPDAWIGWDLGAANLKAVKLDGAGAVCAVIQVACPLREGIDALRAGIEQVLERLDASGACHALTMSGELADIFENRTQGVSALVSAMRERFPGELLKVYAGTAGFVGPDAATGLATQIASANWVAATALAAATLGDGLVVDVGSTTTDIAPFVDFEVAAWGATDHERLVHGELVYSGVVRTPLMALLREVPFDGAWAEVMAEPFATTADVYRLTGALAEHADLLPSADGRAKTAQASATRLARMLGMDFSSGELGDWIRVAEYAEECQLRRLVDAVCCVLSRGQVPHRAPLVGAGVGRFLVRRLAERLGLRYVGFESLLTSHWAGVPDVADCAPAAAVARLAADLGLE